MPPGAVKVDRTTRWGNPFTSPTAARRPSRWPTRPLDARRDRRAGRRRAAVGGGDSHRPRRPRSRLLVSRRRAVPRRPAAAHRQRRLRSRFAGGMRPDSQECEQFAFMIGVLIATRPRPAAMHRLLRRLLRQPRAARASPRRSPRRRAWSTSTRRATTRPTRRSTPTSPSETGIKINRLDGREDELVERIKNEGASSPADILITVDASRLEIADKAGLFQPVQSKALEARIPAHLRTPNWLAFSTRARVIVYNKAAINPDWVQTYEDLADPRLKGADLRALGHASLQPVARRGADRPRRRSEDRAVGARPGRQLRARAQGRRHRPAERRRRRRVRRRPGQQLLRGAPDALDRRRTTRRR